MVHTPKDSHIKGLGNTGLIPAILARVKGHVKIVSNPYPFSGEINSQPADWTDFMQGTRDRQTDRAIC